MIFLDELYWLTCGAAAASSTIACATDFATAGTRLPAIACASTTCCVINFSGECGLVLRFDRLKSFHHFVAKESHHIPPKQLIILIWGLERLLLINILLFVRWGVNALFIAV